MVTNTQAIADLQKRRLNEFRESLPCVYRFFDRERFPRPKIADRIIEEWQSLEEKHEGSPFADCYRPGLILFGESRKGKTQLACELAKQAIKAHESQADARFISAVEWAAEASKKAKACDLDGWAHSLVKFAWRDDCDPGIIIIDDLDKLRCTAVVQSELFGLIEKITANDLRLIVTTNVSGDDLCKKFSSEFGSAIVSRLREFCVPVDFGMEGIP